MDYVLATYPGLQGSTASVLSNWEPTDPVQHQCETLEPSRSGIVPTPTSISPSSSGDKEIFATHNVPAHNEILSLLCIPPAMAEDCLNQFRTNHLQYLPFVYIPRDMTSDQLRERSPFFWICIMDVLTPQNTEKGDSFKRITNHIYQRVMIDPGASMDLLLGMMTFIAWLVTPQMLLLNIDLPVILCQGHIFKKAFSQLICAYPDGGSR